MVGDQTGPWVLALGALAIGGAAAARLVRRQRTDDDHRQPERD